MDRISTNHDAHCIAQAFNAIASIKTAGLIGDKYISIDPGGADERLKPGQTILDTESPVDIGELIGKYAFGDIDTEK